MYFLVPLKAKCAMLISLFLKKHEHLDSNKGMNHYTILVYYFFPSFSIYLHSHSRIEKEEGIFIPDLFLYFCNLVSIFFYLKSDRQILLIELQIEIQRKVKRNIQ